MLTTYLLLTIDLPIVCCKRLDIVFPCEWYLNGLGCNAQLASNSRRKRYLLGFLNFILRIATIIRNKTVLGCYLKDQVDEGYSYYYSY